MFTPQIWSHRLAHTMGWRGEASQRPQVQGKLIKRNITFAKNTKLCDRMLKGETLWPSKPGQYEKKLARPVCGQQLTISMWQPG